MKKLCVLLLALVMMVNCIPAFAAGEAIVQTFKASQPLADSQGKDNFRYVQFEGNKAVNLIWQASDSSMRVSDLKGKITHIITPSPTTDVGMVFTAPMKGVVKITGDIGWPYVYNDPAMDGVKISIGKGEEVLFEADCPYGITAPYDLELNVRKGDEIFFRVNAKRNNGYDVISWFPAVSYVAKVYQGAAGREGYQYLERKNGELKELTYEKDTDYFRASDGIAFMNDYEMMATEDCSMVTRYTVKEAGKQRVTATLKAYDRRSGGNVIKVYHNDKLMWQQLVPEAEQGDVDIRFTAEKDDIIDVEVMTNDFTGFNYGEWTMDVKKFDGALPFAKSSTSQVSNYSVDEEFTLSSKIGATQGNGVEIYALYNDVKFPMTYSNNNWTANVKGDSTCKINSTSVTPGNQRGEPCIALDITKTGTIKIEGALPLNEATNGMLARILVNGKEIWCNRVGGDVSVRFDEPVDKVYFLNHVNVITDVKEGDKLTFQFNRWRRQQSGAYLSIKDVKIKYISGDMLSATTKWKINQSTVLDTVAKKAYFDGQKKNVDIMVNNGTTYIAAADAEAILGSAAETKEIGGKKYVAIRKAAEGLGKTVTWGADRLAIIHDGISVFFGTAEFSEMKAALKGGDLID